MSDSDRARKLRRRHMHERQAVIFGVLIAFLALAFVTAAAIYTGNLNLPWVSKDFVAEPSPTPTTRPVPCPPAGALPVAANQITVNVYNGTPTSGLAKTTSDALVARGFLPGMTLNAGPFDGTARIAFGPTGIAQALTLAAHVDDPEFLLDARADATVDITLGSAFAALKAPESVALDPAKPLAGTPGCVPFDQYINAAATPTPPAATGGAEQPAGEPTAPPAG